jgi:hypothetical protein
MPAGEFAPLAPVLEPSLEGAVVDGAVVAGGFCMVSELSYVSCAIAPTEPIAVRAIVAAAAFQIFISNLLLVQALRDGKPELSPLGSREMPSSAWFHRKRSIRRAIGRASILRGTRVVRNLHLVCDVGAHKTINEGSYARTTAMKTESVTLTRDELSNAITSPVSVFDFPLEVVACPGLSKDQKIEILKRWELDARALQRATDENMDGGEPPLLDEVNRALMMLDPENATADHFGDSPTKI